MNKVYRVLWNEASGTCVAVPENARAAGAGSAGAAVQGAVEVAGGLGASVGHALWALLQPLVAALVSAGLVHAAGPAPDQLPVGGQVAAGSVSIRQNQGVMDILQTSQRAAVNWQSFDVGSAAKVNFNQPQASSVILNRVLGSTPSQIFGQINANGQVFLSNPNGVYFAPGSSVDVGALAATTHKISDADFMAGNYVLERGGATGSVVNEGTLSAKYGGYIALLAPEVRNRGVVLAKMGTVALAAGERYQLQIGSEGRLSNILITPATMAALVDNGNAVEAPGGLVILSAQAASRLQAGVVKNSGVINATGLVSEGGVVRLVASDRIEHTGRIAADAAPNSAGQGGRIEVITDLSNATGRAEIAGNLSARGGNLGGDGGFVETSAANLVIAEGTRVDTGAPQGKFGTWLLDPTDFTISSGSGSGTSSGIGATTLQNNLAGGNISLSTGVASGDLTVGAPVAWSANTTLSLSAYQHVNLNNAITASGASGGLSVTAAVGGSGSINVGANVTTCGAQTYNGSLVLNTAATLKSSAAGIAVTGGIAPGTASALTIDTATAGSVAGVISGATALTKSGVGTLTLSSANLYTGDTSITAGTLKLASTGTLGGATANNYYGALDIASGATFSVTSAANQAIFGVISGSGALTIDVTSAYVLQISGNNTYSGNITVNGGGLKVAGNGYLAGGNYSSAIYLASNARLWWQSTATQTISGVISGAGRLERQGSSAAGSLTLTANNTYTGGTYVGGSSTAVSASASGPIKAGSSTAFGTNTIKVWESGVLDLNGQTISNALTLNGTGISSGGALINSSATAATYAGLITLGSASSIVGGTASIAVSNVGSITGSGFGLTLGGDAGGTLSSVLATSAGTLTKEGTGTWTLTGANSFTGAATVSAGTLKVTHATGLGTTASGTTVASGATLDISAVIGAENVTIQGGTLSSSANGSLAGTVTMTAASNVSSPIINNTLTLSGVVSGAFALTKEGAGDVALSASNTYSGGTIINGGTLIIASDSSLGSQPGVATAGSITLNGGTLYSKNNVTLNSNRGIFLGANGGGLSVAGSKTFVVGGVIDGSGTLSVAGGTTGIVQLSGLNTYTGSTTIELVSLSVSSDSNLGAIPAASTASSITLIGGAFLQATAGFTLNVNRGITLHSTGGQIAASSGTFSVAGVVAGAGSLTTYGNLSLSGINTYSGGTSVRWGTLQTGATAALGTGATTIGVNSGSTASLDLNGQTIANALKLYGSGNGAAGALINSSATSATYAGLITLGSASSIVGGTGSIAVTNADSITGSGFGLTLGGAVGGSLSSPLATGAGTLTKEGVGTWTLAGANTYTGATTISGGTLQIGGTAGHLGSGTSYAGAISVASGGVLQFSSPVAQTLSGVISGLGSVALSGSAATLTLSGSNSFTGGTAVGAGTLALGANNVFADAGGVTVSGTGTLSLGAFSDTVANVSLQGTGAITSSTGVLTSTGAYDLQAGSVSAILAGSTGVNKTTAGTVTLSGVNTYTGTTVISGGMLQISGSLGSGSYADNITLASSAVLQYSSGAAQRLSGIISGLGTLLKDSNASTLTLTGANSYTGGTTVSAGTLALGANNVLADAGAVTVSGTGALSMGAYLDTVASVSLQGTGAITGSTGVLTSAGAYDLQAGTASAILAGSAGATKTGAGTVTLSGANTYSGGTSVSAGTLRVGSDGALGASAVTVGSGSSSVASLDLNGQTIANALALYGYGSGGAAGAVGALTNSSATAATASGTVGLGSATSLGGSGAITVSGAMAANGNGLVLLGAGADTLSNTGNTLSTLASGAGVGSVAVNNGSALALGSVSLGATTYSGIASSGAVSVATTVGDLTVSRAVTAGTSLVLAAGAATAAGTSSGGNVVLSGAPSLTGTSAKIYTGALAGSTGVAVAVGSGSGNFRYNSSQSTANYSLALGTGLQAIYREQPTYSVTANSAADITYGASAPAYTFTGLGQNGDTALQALGSAAAVADDGVISGAGKLKAGTHTLAVGGAVNQLGYALAYATGTITVNRATLAVGGLTAANKTYDAGLVATLSGTAAITALAGDVVTLGGTASGSFATKTAANGKAVTVSGNTISGGDAGNYNLVQQTGLTANITKADLLVTGLTAANKTYNANTVATLGGSATATAQGADVVALGGTAV
ncbi:MAG: autotransporter-associated beta strand repeat-containing protein, partial [Betaproteobacteria bacterium]